MELISKDKIKAIHGLRSFQQKLSPQLLGVLGFDFIEERDFFYDKWLGSSSMLTVALFFDDDIDVFYTDDVFDMHSTTDKSVKNVSVKNTRQLIEIAEQLTNKKFRINKKGL